MNVAVAIDDIAREALPSASEAGTVEVKLALPVADVVTVAEPISDWPGP